MPIFILHPSPLPSCPIKQENAYVYVCGDADNMARDVHAALKSILLTHGGPIRFPDPAAADTFLSQLKQRQRYVLDIWT